MEGEVMADNRTLDIRYANSVEQIIDMITDYEILNGKSPETLLFKSSTLLSQLLKDSDLMPIIRQSCDILLGIKIIFDEDIKRWHEFRRTAEPIGFWTVYWSQGNDLCFDPFKECDA